MTDTGAPVWFITGCSTGFGRELAQRIVQRGWRSIVTARNVAHGGSCRFRR
jgi:NAD(P)-dependent dehydrogenase (short-subunit alcohol dehydrogenase family)